MLIRAIVSILHWTAFFFHSTNSERSSWQGKGKNFKRKMLLAPQRKIQGFAYICKQKFKEILRAFEATWCFKTQDACGSLKIFLLRKMAAQPCVQCYNLPADRAYEVHWAPPGALACQWKSHILICLWLSTGGSEGVTMPCLPLSAPQQHTFGFLFFSFLRSVQSSLCQLSWEEMFRSLEHSCQIEPPNRSC